MLYFSVSPTRIPPPSVLQYIIRSRRRMVLSVLEHSPGRLPRTQIQDSARNVWDRLIWSNEHHERRRLNQMPERRLGQARFLLIIVLLLSIRVCNSIRECACTTRYVIHLSINHFSIPMYNKKCNYVYTSCIKSLKCLY